MEKESQASIDALVKRWLASLSPKERELQELAAKVLETSYFPEKTHGFRKWFAAQNTAA